jgi:hypothetical protein
MSEYSGLKRKHVQRFLSAANTKSKRGVVFDEYDEPTYLGFWVKFNFNEGILDGSGLMDANNLPAGLLADFEANYSAERYLKNIGYPNRAETLKAFKELLKSISEESPWYITSIEGLNEIYKLDSVQNFRGKDKKITLEFLEGIDMRVTSMFDAYRKSAFDAVYMRYLLPDIMRYFSMNVYVTEFRTFHRPNRIADNKAIQEPPTPGGNQYGIDPSKGPIAATAGQLQNAFGEDASKNRQEQVEKFNSWLRGTGGDGSTDGHFLEYLDDHLSVIKFELSDCEFELESLEPSWASALKTEAADAATYKAVIKVGKIREIAGYPILFDVIAGLTSKNFSDDSLSESSYGDQPARNGGKLLDIQKELRVSQGEDANDPNAVYNQGPYRNGHLRNLKNVVKKSLGERLLNGLEEAAFARGRNFLQEQINGRLLGNVYGTSPSTILRSLSENPNALEAALRNTLARATNATVADSILGNIYDILPEPSSTISGNPGSTDLLSSGSPINGVVEGNFSGTATSGNNPGNAGLADNGADLNGNPGNIGFIAAPSNPANLTNIGLTDNGSSLEGNPGNAGLADNGADLSGNPGNAGLADNGTDLSGNPGNAGLADNGSSLEGNPGNAGLADNGSTLSGNVGNAGLSDNGSSLEGSPGNAGLADNGSSLDGSPENVGLTDNGSSLEGSLENIGLKDNQSNLSGNPGNVGLNNNGSNIKGNVGNVGLSDNGNTLEGNPGNVGLADNGATIDGNLSNIDLKDNGSNIAGNPGNVGLSGSTKTEETLGNVGLKGSNASDKELGNVGLTGNEDKKQNPGTFKLEGDKKIEEDLRNIGYTEDKVNEKILGNIGLTGSDINKENLGNIGLKEPSRGIDEKLGNIGYENSIKVEQTLGNIGLKSEELRKTNPGNINLKETTPTNSELGNIGYEEKIKLVRQLGNVNFDESETVKSALGNIGFESRTKSQSEEIRNIGLEGGENNLTPPTGTDIQNSSSDLPPIEN